MDVVGGVLLEDGTECKILTGIDDHSRFLVCAGIMTRAISRQVCGHFAAALEKYGAPGRDPHRQRQGLHQSLRTHPHGSPLRPALS